MGEYSENTAWNYVVVVLHISTLWKTLGKIWRCQRFHSRPLFACSCCFFILKAEYSGLLAYFNDLNPVLLIHNRRLELIDSLLCFGCRHCLGGCPVLSSLTLLCLWEDCVECYVSSSYRDSLKGRNLQSPESDRTFIFAAPDYLSEDISDDKGNGNTNINNVVWWVILQVCG